jgi:ABC-type sugar transport system substrate-binding protein
MRVALQKKRWLIGFLVIGATLIVGSSESTAGRARTELTPLQLAQATVNKYTAIPTRIPVTAPHTKPIPTGKSIAYVTCGVATCVDISNAIKAAAKVLGWKYTQVNSNGTPESVKAAWDTLVRLHPTAVLGSGFNRAAFEPELQKLKAMHVGFFDCCSTDPPGNGITLNLSGLKDQGQQGDAQAAWAAVQTKGKANVLFVNLPDFAIEAGVKTAFFANLPRYCPGCKVASIDVPITGIPTAANTIVSYLRSHPDVNWVALDQDALAPGLPAALKAAGLSHVQFSGQGATAVNYQYIQAGQQSASVEFPIYEFWWTEVDAIARWVNGESLAPDTIPTPFHLVTKANLKDPTGTKPIVPGLVAQFKKLWGR